MTVTTSVRSSRTTGLTSVAAIKRITTRTARDAAEATVAVGTTLAAASKDRTRKTKVVTQLRASNATSLSAGNEEAMETKKIKRAKVKAKLAKLIVGAVAAGAETSEAEDAEATRNVITGQRSKKETILNFPKKTPQIVMSSLQSSSNSSRTKKFSSPKNSKVWSP